MFLAQAQKWSDFKSVRLRSDSDSLRYGAYLASSAANNNGSRQFLAHIGVAIIFEKYQVRIEFGLQFQVRGKLHTESLILGKSCILFLDIFVFEPSGYSISCTPNHRL